MVGKPGGTGDWPEYGWDACAGVISYLGGESRRSGARLPSAAGGRPTCRAGRAWACAAWGTGCASSGPIGSDWKLPLDARDLTPSPPCRPNSSGRGAIGCASEGGRNSRAIGFFPSMDRRWSPKSPSSFVPAPKSVCGGALSRPSRSGRKGSERTGAASAARTSAGALSRIPPGRKKASTSMSSSPGMGGPRRVAPRAAERVQPGPHLRPRRSGTPAALPGRELLGRAASRGPRETRWLAPFPVRFGAGLSPGKDSYVVVDCPIVRFYFPSPNKLIPTLPTSCPHSREGAKP